MKYFGGRKTRRNKKGKKTGGGWGWGDTISSGLDKFTNTTQEQRAAKLNAAANVGSKFASDLAAKGSEIGKNVQDQFQQRAMDAANTAANAVNMGSAQGNPVGNNTTATGAKYPAGKIGGRRRYRKGSRSKTRKGRKDFITHKGSKYYNRRGHRQTRNSKGRKGRPYRKRRTHKRGAGCGNNH